MPTGMRWLSVLPAPAPRWRRKCQRVSTPHPTGSTSRRSMYDRKKSIDGALNKIGRNLESNYGSEASKGPSGLGEGGTPGPMAADDKEAHGDEDKRNTLDEIRDYESRLLGRDTHTSAHLTGSPPDRSRENQGGAPSEGDENYPGSIETEGSYRKDKGSATTSVEDDDDQEDVYDVATEQGPFQGYTPQRHKNMQSHRGPLVHKTGKSVP